MPQGAGILTSQEGALPSRPGEPRYQRSWSGQDRKHPYLLGKHEVRRSFAQRKKSEALDLAPVTTSNIEWKYFLEITLKMRDGNSQVCLWILRGSGCKRHTNLLRSHGA